MPNPENPLALDTDAMVKAVVERNDPTAEARRALADVAWCLTPETLEISERIHRTDMVPLLRAALAEVDRLRTRLAIVERETARAVEAERAATVAWLRYPPTSWCPCGCGQPIRPTHEMMADSIANGAHRTDDPLPSAIEAAREEGRKAERAKIAADLDRWAEEGDDPWMSFCAGRVREGAKEGE